MKENFNIKFDEYDDRNKYLNNLNVKNICEFLVEDERHSEFLVILADIIVECKDYDELNQGSYLERYFEEFGQDVLFAKFISYIYEFYKNSKGKNVDIGNLRGAILERLSALLIAERYLYPPNDIHFPLDNWFKENCELRINCDVELPDIKWRTKNPIDIGAWNSDTKKGECYECKVNVNSMRESDDLILHDLQSKSYILCKDINAQLDVGVITFFHTDPYKYYSSYKDIKLYGRNNLSEIGNI